jgi:predicted DCC family thiol-disulfide oxidoreductase YuxK
MQTPAPFTIFYDGLCPLCAREIAHYRKCAKSDPAIVFQDITAPGFDAGSFGLDPARVHKEMHANEGETVTVGVDAFLAIWRRVPGHRWMLHVAKLPLANLLMRAGYWIFARLRPWLPRLKPDCRTDYCRR